MDKVLIIIPTYNEKENIYSLTDALLSIGNCLDVLVVDDASPDGTSVEIKKHHLFNQRVFILERMGKAGRGSACVEGFLYAFNKNRYSHIVEMDADFSHDPRELPAILERAKNYDVVIGSRYLKGSKIIGWGVKRKVFSRLANIYARFILKVPILDYTNGYRCYKTSELEKLPLRNFESSGYITLSEIAYKMHLNGCKFSEVPITFINRRRGRSNLSFKEIKEAFLLVPRLRFGSMPHGNCI